MTIRTTKWPPSIFFRLGSVSLYGEARGDRLGKHTPRPDDAAIFFLPSNDLVFHGNVLEGEFYFYLLKNFFFFTRCRVTCRDMKSTHELS